MKKAIFLIVFLIAAIGFTAAQDFTVYKAGTVTTLVASDTITDTESNDTTVLIKLPDKKPLGLSCHVIAANLTGTTDIDVDYESSNDGTNFYAVASDSLAAGNLQYIHEDIDGFTGRYFRITWTGVGTQSSTFKAYLYVFEIP